MLVTIPHCRRRRAARPDAAAGRRQYRRSTMKITDRQPRNACTHTYLFIIMLSPFLASCFLGNGCCLPDGAHAPLRSVFVVAVVMMST